MIIATVVLVVDLIIPLGVAAGVPYVALVLTGIWYTRSWHIYLLATVGTVLTIIGYFASPEGGIHWMVLFNRVLAVFAIWIVALLVIASSARAKMRIDRSEHRFQGIVDNVINGIVTINEQGAIESFNPAAEKMFGYSANEVIGENISILMPEPVKSRHDSYIQNYLHTGEGQICSAGPREVMGLHKSGKSFVLELAVSKMHIGDRLLFVGIFIDITERKQANKNLNYQASHDGLTGLINRTEFERRAERLLSTIQKDKSTHALFFMDLDQFKVINDTCGHIAGDELLRQIAQVLQGVVRRRDTLARLGGDEFGVLVEHCSLEQAQRVANALRQGIDEFQFFWEGQSFRVGVSIGLVAVNETTPSLTELMKQADTACYMAKDLGRNRIHTYQPEDVELARRLGQMHWVAGINQALEEDRFCLYAQAIVPLDDSTQRHYEMLLRMIDGEGNIIGPGTFFSAAERYGLMGKLDRWVIENALALLAENPAFLGEIEFISINLSGESLSSSDFLDFIIVQLKKSGIDANKICFEITETLAISNLSAATTFISTLKKTGCYFALDDFGSGLSSFAYLKNLPVDYLKIDGMFVRNIVDDPIDRAMVKSINDIGQIMGLQTIAEYVETDEIKDVLRQIGVDYAQGFGVGEPLAFEELIDQSLFKVKTLE